MYFQSFFVFLPNFKQCCITSNWKLFLYHLKPFFPQILISNRDYPSCIFWLNLVLTDLQCSFLTYHGPFWLTMVLSDLPWSFLTYPCPSWLKTRSFLRWLCPSWPNTVPLDLINQCTYNDLSCLFWVNPILRELNLFFKFETSYQISEFS